MAGDQVAIILEIKVGSPTILEIKVVSPTHEYVP